MYNDNNCDLEPYRRKEFKYWMSSQLELGIFITNHYITQLSDCKKYECNIT